MLMFLLDYDDVEFKITKQRQRQSKAQPDNESLYLRSSDGDWHWPFLSHVRRIDLPSGHGQRKVEATKKRRQREKARRAENQALNHVLKDPPVRTHR